MKKNITTPNNESSKSLTNNSHSAEYRSDAIFKVQKQMDLQMGDSTDDALCQCGMSKAMDSSPITTTSNVRKKVVIIGGEGHGSMIAEVIQDNQDRYCDFEWEMAGFCNELHEEIDGYPVLGRTEDIPRLIEEGYYFAWAVYILNRNYQTVDFFNSINIPAERWATIIHKSAFVSKSAIIESGAFIMYGSYIGPRTIIGKCSMVKANVNIGHDVKISPLCHISMGANINSNAKLGIGAYISVGAQVMLNKSVGAYSMLGAQSLAMSDIPEGEIYVGVPARFIKKMNRE